MNEVGYWHSPSFPRQCCVVIVIIGTMTPSDSLSSLHHFVSTYRFQLYFHTKVTRRVSPVPLITFLTCRSPYPERFFGAASKFCTPSVVFAHIIEARLLFGCQMAGSFDETAGFTLCYNLSGRSHSAEGATLSQGFNLRISPPAACQLLSVLALTQIGLSPTSN